MITTCPTSIGLLGTRRASQAIAEKKRLRRRTMQKIAINLDDDDEDDDAEDAIFRVTIRF